MGLKEVQEELKEQIKEAEEREAKALEPVEEAPKEEAPPEPEKVEEKPEEKPVEEPKPEVKSPAERAAERRAKIRESDLMREELARAQARISELEKARETPKQADTDPEPNKAEDREGWLEWETRQARKTAERAVEETKEIKEWKQKEEQRRKNENLKEQALNELRSYEAKAMQAIPDFEDAKKFYANTLAFSIKSLNPKISDEALVRAVNDRIMMRASELMNEGYDNPLEGMYEEVKALGYKRKEKAVEVEEKKPDLDRVAQNRARNAGTAAASGSAGRGELTKTYAANEMTVAEWAKLPAAEKKRLMASM